MMIQAGLPSAGFSPARLPSIRRAPGLPLPKIYLKLTITHLTSLSCRLRQVRHRTLDATLSVSSIDTIVRPEQAGAGTSVKRVLIHLLGVLPFSTAPLSRHQPNVCSMGRMEASRLCVGLPWRSTVACWIRPGQAAGFLDRDGPRFQ
jgi:hypothetical protein